MREFFGIFFRFCTALKKAAADNAREKVAADKKVGQVCRVAACELHFSHLNQPAELSQGKKKLEKKSSHKAKIMSTLKGKDIDDFVTLLLRKPFRKYREEEGLDQEDYEGGFQSANKVGESQQLLVFQIVLHDGTERIFKIRKRMRN